MSNNCLISQWLAQTHGHSHTYTCVTALGSATAELQNKLLLPYINSPHHLVAHYRELYSLLFSEAI